jgi:hypothetical protein
MQDEPQNYLKNQAQSDNLVEKNCIFFGFCFREDWG